LGIYGTLWVFEHTVNMFILALFDEVYAQFGVYLFRVLIQFLSLKLIQL